MVVLGNVIKPQGLEPLQFPTKFRAPSVEDNRLVEGRDSALTTRRWPSVAADELESLVSESRAATVCYAVRRRADFRPMDLFERLASALTDSQTEELARYLLGNVPGLPPIVQTLHIVGISVVMASIVMVDLRFLGLAVPSQNVSEMIGRLLPWTWWALPLNAMTGFLFIAARPSRYFENPVFGIKFSLLVPAVALAVVVYGLNRKETGYWERTLPRRISGRVIAACSLVLWIGVVMAGRWIAYWDYLFY